MEQLHAVIEITNDKIRLVAGYVLENEPVIIYSVSKDIKGMVRNNLILDHEGVVQAIKQIAFIENPNLRLKLKVKEATIILPPNGLKVFQSRKTTNVVSATNLVEPLDINNAINLVKKDVPETSSAIVDIIPGMFILADGTKYSKPPLGASSKTIEIFANIHVLPRDIVDKYASCFADAGIRVTGMVVSPYALAAYADTIGSLPKSYILIDMGHAMTSYTCIGRGYPYGTAVIDSGIKGLIDKVSESFAVSNEEALKLINLYGIDHRDCSFHPVIATAVDEFGRKTSFNQDNLNTIITSYLDEYFNKFITPIEVILTSLRNDKSKARTLPLVFTGSLIRIPGIKEVIKEKFATNQSISYLRSETIGASIENYCACVGGLLVSNNQSGSLSSVENKVSSISRN